MRAVIYARVSSQAQRDRQTIASQISTLPRFVAERGWTLVRPADTYVDDGRTAKAGHLEARAGFARLMRDAAAKIFDVVVVVDLDRLTRSEDLRERGEVLGAFQLAGVQIAVAATGQVLDLSSSLGDLMSNLGAWFSAEANRKHRERIMRGKLEAISKGKKPAGPTPFGYLYDRSPGKWSIDPVLGPIVVEIFERVAGGETTEDVARSLHERGVRRARGGTWNRERVWAIVTSATYRGEWTADKARGLKVPVPRIVSDELWYAADDRLRAWGLRGRKRARHTYLCQGIAVCGVCGGRIGISTHSDSFGKQLRRAYYVCQRRRRPRWGGDRCMAPMHPVADVDRVLWERIVAVLSDTERLERLLAEHGRGSLEDHDAAADDLRNAEAQLKRAAKAETVILDRFSRGMVSEEAMDASLEAAKRRRALLERQVTSARQRAGRAATATSASAALRGVVDRLRAALPNAGPEERADLVRHLIPGRDEHHITLGPARGRLEAVAYVAADDTRDVGLSRTAG